MKQNDDFITADLPDHQNQNPDGPETWSTEPAAQCAFAGQSLYLFHNKKYGEFIK